MKIIKYILRGILLVFIKIINLIIDFINGSLELIEINFEVKKIYFNTLNYDELPKFDDISNYK